VESCRASRVLLRTAGHPGRTLLAHSPITTKNFTDYVRLNERFHTRIIELADSRVLARQIERAVSLPFASASAFVMVQAALPEAQTMFTIAQDHHRCVLQAIKAREGTRAEALMREHARLARRNLELALRSPRTRMLVPGSGLIRLRASTAG
jgi:GntR family transcriptional regulator of vanillate catabolism